MCCTVGSWSEKIPSLCETAVANCETGVSQGRKSINLTERGLKALLGKDMYGEGSPELEG